jgi:hypothetical protein
MYAVGFSLVPTEQETNGQQNIPLRHHALQRTSEKITPKQAENTLDTEKIRRETDKF